LVVVAAGDGHEDLGPEDLDGRGDARATGLGRVVRDESALVAEG
jgi:hypothetical protein